jgi:hypothetical protein
MKPRSAMRKPSQRATKSPASGDVTADDVRVWLEDRLAADPKLRASIRRVMAALRRAEAAAPVRRRRAR